LGVFHQYRYLTALNRGSPGAGDPSYPACDLAVLAKPWSNRERLLEIVPKSPPGEHGGTDGINGWH
jgi:hypothetical protein